MEQLKRIRRNYLVESVAFFAILCFFTHRRNKMYRKRLEENFQQISKRFVSKESIESINNFAGRLMLLTTHGPGCITVLSIHINDGEATAKIHLCQQ